jgi:hypothetical protein
VGVTSPEEGLAPPPTRLGALAAVMTCALALWWAFALGERVPLLWGVDLGFHELGHLLAAWMPTVLTALAGSATQVAVPLGLAAYFGLLRRQPLSASLMLAWAGTSAQNVSVYVADAPTQYLPLLGGGRYDWAYILADHLDWAAPLAWTVWLAGLLLAIGGLALAVWRLAEPSVRAWLDARERVRLARLPRHEPRNRMPLPELGMLEEEPVPQPATDPPSTKRPT